MNKIPDDGDDDMRSKNAQIKQYANQYLIANTKMILIIAVPVSLLFFVVACFSDVLRYDWVISVFPLLIGLSVLFFCYIRTFRFAKMIQSQESLLNTTFPIEPLIPLYRKTLFYTSEDWFIRAGCWAFHRDYIERITVHTLNEKSPARSYVVDVYTTDHQKIVLRGMQSGEIKQFKHWINSKKQ